MQMEGCGAVIAAVMVLIVVGALAVGAVVAADKIAGAEKAAHERAIVEARAESEARQTEAEQETARLEEANRHREEMFRSWTTALAAFTGNRDPWLSWLVPALFGAVAGAVVIVFLQRRA